jgi:4-hydroxybenzoate polyprenyltransferase|tara:strand:- start:6671 stop:7444 length:774 start_codon:yes stop_codon:yes gene_type:complete
MHISRIFLRKRNNINMLINPLPGTEIGIPLFFLEKTFTNLHYGIDINTKELFFFQSLVGFLTYGTDRLLDSINSPDNNKELNLYFRKNKEFLGILLLLAYGIIIKDLISVEETRLLVIPLTSTFYYKEFKERFGELKAIYISSFWVLASVIIPCVWYEGNYNILYDPLNYMPCFLSILGTSNLADIKDLKEDKEDGIRTWPVILGKENSAKVSILILLISTYLVGINSNIYKFPIESSLFELQNIGSIIYATNLTLK